MKTYSPTAPIEAASSAVNQPLNSANPPEPQDVDENEVRVQVRNRVRLVELLKKELPISPS